MSFITYAQNFEDLMLWRALRHIKHGFYVDVGAYDPVEYSVTKAFYDAGWRGINIEPSRQWFDKLRRARSDDINIHAAAGRESGETDLFVFKDTGLSTISEDEAREFTKAGFGEPKLTKVQTVTLDGVCKENNVGTIHFLKIDAEGAEEEILRGASFEEYRPWIVVVEATAPFTNVDISAAWQPYLLEKGYLFAYFDGLNKFYVAQEHKQICESFRLPPNVIDDYTPAWKIKLESENQELVQFRARVAKLEEQVRQSEVKLTAQAASFEEQIQQRDIQLAAQAVDLEETGRRLAASISEAKEAKFRIFNAETQLDRLYNSKSWKITAPLRRANHKLNIGVRCASAYARVAALNLILRAYPIVARNEFLKAQTRSILDRFPRLKHKIMGILLRRRLQNAQQVLPNRVTEPLELHSAEADIRDNERIVLLYVEHTAQFDRVTGIQRVCHKLAEMLESQGETVILVKLDPATLELASLNYAERQHFLIQSGRIPGEHDARYYDPAAFKQILTALYSRAIPSWLIIPEVTYHTAQQNPPTSRLIKLSRDLGLKVGVIFYDNIPLLTRDALENAEKHVRYLSTIALADVIWPISRYSANLIADFYRRHEMLGDEEMPTISLVSLAEEMDVPREIRCAQSFARNIVCVGTIDERKNQITLIRAFNKYCEKNPDTDWKLHVIGLVRNNYRKVIEAECSSNPNIELHYHATREDVERFYENCDFTVFPSLEEGYGLPIVESLWSIRPCICANFGSMAELQIGGGCLAVDTRSVDAILGAITLLIENNDVYRQKVAEILRRPVKSWFEYAGNIVADMDKYKYGKQQTGLIYYWVDATLSASSNTGIQRVNRQLAKHLAKSGHQLVPIKWDERSEKIILASSDDLDYLARWNGPARDCWHMLFEEDQIDSTATYLMAELPLNRSLDVQRRVIEFFGGMSVRGVAVFYDAIPYKMSALYPPHFTQAHVGYMELLDNFDLIFPISETSSRDLLEFLNGSPCRGLSLETRIRAIGLPSEFPEREINRAGLSRKENNECQILVVGTVEPRKNHETLIHAFNDAAKKSPRRLKLVIVGGDESFDKELPQKIEALISENSEITWIKQASDTVLQAQFALADFTVFPSVEEGFGMPIVESLSLGIPCICSGDGQMGELASHGGCEIADVLSVDSLCAAIVRLANDPDRVAQLKQEIRSRYFKTWDDYAAEVSAKIFSIPPSGIVSATEPTPRANQFFPPRPTLSICITTYNRAGWLSINLKNLMKVSSGVRDKIEIVVCDNASSDETSKAVMQFLNEKNFFYFRNSANIGMLGNLPQTVSFARGDYVWLIGDDDLLHEGALEKILGIIENDAPDLINVNYAYTANPAPPDADSLESYFSSASKIASQDGLLPVSQIKNVQIKNVSAFNENFYTAIYTFVVKRRYAQKIFSQDTSGPPFSSLQTCVPSSKYILSQMMELSGCWMGDPQITINMNVSWGKYAPLWVLERLPEVYDLAELNGADREQVDHWRRHTLQMVPNFFEILFQAEYETSISSFDITRFIRRSRHLAEFRALYPELEKIYAEALKKGHPLAKISLDRLRAVMQ